MEQFKLKSIDEFDAEFASLIGMAAPKEEIKAEPEEKKTGFEINIPNETEAAPAEAPQEKEEKKPFSLFDGIDEDDDEEEAPKAKSSKGALAGKIIAIIMLAVTVVVFVLGCFVSVFLDNNGVAIAGTTLNTMAADNEKLNISKGSLVPGKILADDAYAVGDIVAVPTSTGDGVELLQIINIQLYTEDAVFTVNDVNGYGSSEISSDYCYGKVTNYMPGVASIINFATSNAILVCILFVLLAALWCLVLVLIEKSGAKAVEAAEENAEENPEEEKEETDLQ